MKRTRRKFSAEFKTKVVLEMSTDTGPVDGTIKATDTYEEIISKTVEHAQA